MVLFVYSAFVLHNCTVCLPGPSITHTQLVLCTSHRRYRLWVPADPGVLRRPLAALEMYAGVGCAVAVGGSLAWQGLSPVPSPVRFVKGQRVNHFNASHCFPRRFTAVCELQEGARLLCVPFNLASTRANDYHNPEGKNWKISP